MVLITVAVESVCGTCGKTSSPPLRRSVKYNRMSPLICFKCYRAPKRKLYDRRYAVKVATEAKWIKIIQPGEQTTMPLNPLSPRNILTQAYAALKHRAYANGQPICTSQEFLAAYLDDPTFNSLYLDWAEDDFKEPSGSIPYIRLKSGQYKTGFTIANMEWVPWDRRRDKNFRYIPETEEEREQRHKLEAARAAELESIRKAKREAAAKQPVITDEIIRQNIEEARKRTRGERPF